MLPCVSSSGCSGSSGSTSLPVHQIDRADGASGIDGSGFAFIRTVADGGRFFRLPVLVLHKSHKVGFVYLIEEMDGVFALVVPVNDDIKVGW